MDSVMKNPPHPGPSTGASRQQPGSPMSLLGAVVIPPMTVVISTVTVVISEATVVNSRGQLG